MHLLEASDAFTNFIQTFHYTRLITPKRVTSFCGVHLRVIAPRQHSYYAIA